MYNLTIDGQDQAPSDVQTAMKAMHAAKGVGRTASMRKAGDPAPTPNVRAGEVSQVAVARITRDEQRLLDRGIALPPPIYAAGSKVVQWGHDNFRTSRQSWEDMPETIDGLRQAWVQVRREKRTDHEVSVRDLRMNNDGTLDFGQGRVGVEVAGLKSLLGRNAELFPRAGTFMSMLDPDVRALNFNRQIKKADKKRRLVLRTRRSPSGRSVYAAVSKKYTAFDADKIIHILGDALKDTGMRGEVTVNPATTDLRVNGIYHADTVVDLAAGDVFKTGVQFRSNDAAGGSIQGKALAWRNLCLNLIIIGTGEKELLRQMHKGGFHTIRGEVVRAATEGSTFFTDFAQDWGILRATPAADVFEGETIEDIMSEMAQLSAMDVGVRRDTLVEMLLAGHQHEPGDTLADLANAVTAVHLHSEVNNWRREQFEEAAGLLVPVLASRVTAEA